MYRPFSTEHRMAWSRIVAAAVLLYLFLFPPPGILPTWALEACEVSGLALLSLACFGRLWCLLFIAGRKRNAVVRQGPYSVVRNPLYVFSFLGVVGLGLGAENPILAALLAAAFAGYYHFVVTGEEDFLSGRFGPEYESYRTSVPRWIPKLELYSAPSTVEVDTKRFLRGIGDAMWFVWAFFLWEIVELYRAA